jgi:cytochrome c-type biogenesis protein CcmF
MGVGPLIAWRRASLDNLRRNFLWPVGIGLAAAAVFFALGVRSAVAGLTLALTIFVATTIAVDYLRATRARRRMGEALMPAMGGLLVRHNRRYGGFVIHLGILVIAVGITGSQAWSLQREATLKRGEAVQIAGYTFRFDGLSARENGNHFLVESAFNVTNGGAPRRMHPAKKFYPQEQSPIAHVDYTLGFIEDLYIVLGDFERDGTQATVKVQVNRMVSWIWIGGLILTMGTVLAVIPERKKPA